jgi:hypothetical protein
MMLLVNVAVSLRLFNSFAGEVLDRCLLPDLYYHRHIMYSFLTVPPVNSCVACHNGTPVNALLLALHVTR